MKKILALAAVAALTGVSAYAANPFSDVSASDWAYQAVSELSDQGIVEGYPDGTFKGQQNMTRYELAQVIARLMAREDQLNAEQKATVDKLAAEFADELANLGVRVSNVEKRLGNVSFTGDARLQYQRDSEKKDAYNARVRLSADSKVNDKVTVSARLAGEMDFLTGDKAMVEMDQLHVVYAPSDAFSLDLGRTGVTLGTGAYYDNDFDGAVASLKLGAASLQAGYGRPKGIELGENLNKEFAYANANVELGDVATVGGFYGRFLQKDLAGHKKFYGFTGSVKVAGLVLDGDYVTYDVKNAAKKTPKFYNVGLTYGEVDTNEVGSYSVGVRYFDVDAGSYFGGSNLDLDFADDASKKNGAKFFVAKVGVAPMKGVELDAYYNFKGKDKSEAKNKIGDAFGVELNYAF